MLRRKRVLIVDDSALVRHRLRALIADDPEFEVVGEAGSGQECLTQVATLQPDVVTLDVWMPGLDGLKTLRQIMQHYPTPVLMVSSLSEAGGQITLDALSYGAIDYVTKPAAMTGEAAQPFAVELLQKLRIAASVSRPQIRQAIAGVPAIEGGWIDQRSGSPVVAALGATTDHLATNMPPRFQEASSPGRRAALPEGSTREEMRAWLKARRDARAHMVDTTEGTMSAPCSSNGTLSPVQGAANRAAPATATLGESGAEAARSATPLGRTSPPVLVVIGSSTGGPQMLDALFMGLSSERSAAFLVVQHMPPLFTQSLAARLDRRTSMTVREATEGDLLRTGTVLVAPGGWHMTLGDDNRMHLDQTAPLHNVRPAVDRTLLSLANHWSGRLLVVILTGMGVDGVEGARALHRRGAEIYAQDEETSIVYGMPRAVVEAGLAHAVLPIERMATAIRGWATGSKALLSAPV